MSDTPPSPATRTMFDETTKMLGLTIPEDRKESIFQGYVALRAMTDMLRRPRTAVNEPAGVFVPSTIGREG
jgi:hypothetical protein